MKGLRKIEGNFHELIGKFLNRKCIGDYEYSLPELDEELLNHERFHRVPGMFGGFFYFMTVEDGRYVLYAHASSRMDFDELYIVDEESYRWIENGNYYEKLGENKIKVTR